MHSVLYIILRNKINRSKGLLISLRRCVLERPTPLPLLKLKYYLLYNIVTLSRKVIPSFVSIAPSQISNHEGAHTSTLPNSEEGKCSVWNSAALHWLLD
jgi:hypothetical protein